MTTGSQTPALGQVTAAGDRGRIVVRDRVVEKVAAAAAADATDVLRRRSLRGSNERGVQVVADVDGERARLEVTVTLAYPCDTRTTVDGIRGRVIDQVETLTGVRVRRLRVRVSDFLAGTEE